MPGRPKAKALGYQSGPTLRSNDNSKGKSNKRKQRRNTGISPLRRQTAPPSVEMTFVVGEGRKQTTAKTETDPYGMTNKRTSNNNGNRRSRQQQK
jgi:hypothetical protein